MTGTPSIAENRTYRKLEAEGHGFVRVPLSGFGGGT